MNKPLCRGKRITNGEWIESEGVHKIYTRLCLDWDRSWEEIVPESLSFFTGLTDKNGKKVFEGDIIKHNIDNGLGVIRYGEYQNPFNDSKNASHIGFHVEWHTGRDVEFFRKDLGYWLKISEIIGNIHDNPDLLNE